MVHLGVCDEAIRSASVSLYTDSQLGGLPHWVKPGITVPSCALCGKTSLLVTQLYAPLVSSPHHRVVYVFACGEDTCQNKSEAWSVLRALCEVRSEAAVLVKEQEEKVVVDDWGVGDDDWGGGGEDYDDDWGDGGDGDGLLDALLTTTNQVTESLSRLEVTTSAAVGVLDNSSTDFFIPFYLYVMEEPDKELSSLKTQKYEIGESSEGGSDGGKENYEKSDVKDREFYKFYKKIKLCPEQCIRYDMGGKPLLLPPNTTIPNCTVCGANRRFEFQLMPALISILKTAECRRSLDFRTVLVYTCEGDCFDGGSEFVVCVPEPDVMIPSHKTNEHSQMGS